VGLLFAIMPVPTRAAQKCLEYGPAVTLTGTLHSRVFAGPPNYESIKRGDAKETAIVLKLMRPTCTKGGDPVGVDVSFVNIREMQLVVYSDDTSKNDELWRTVNRRMGKRVVVTGTLFGAHTGHHRTNVLIQIADIRAPRRQKHLSSNILQPDSRRSIIRTARLEILPWEAKDGRGYFVEAAWHSGEAALSGQLPWIIQASLA